MHAPSWEFMRQVWCGCIGAREDYLQVTTHYSSGMMAVSADTARVATTPCFGISKGDFSKGKLHKHSVCTMSMSRSCRRPCKVIITPPALHLWPGPYHAWLVFHSAERCDRPMKLPALLWVKPKTNHYGCVIRVIIRLSTRTWGLHSG